MSACCMAREDPPPLIGGGRTRAADKALWYALAAFYGLGALYLMGLAASHLT